MGLHLPEVSLSCKEHLPSVLQGAAPFCAARSSSLPSSHQGHLKYLCAVLGGGRRGPRVGAGRRETMLGPACYSLLLHPYLTPRVEKLLPESEFSQGVRLDPWQERAPCLPS